jgi:hypothetical protein
MQWGPPRSSGAGTPGAEPASAVARVAPRQGGSPRLAGAVLRHLELLADRGDLPGVIAATCEHAADLWIGLSRAPAPHASAAPAASPATAAAGMRALLRRVTERGPTAPGVSP